MENIMMDLHTHTSFSPDAESSLKEMAQRAQELGLRCFAVTDHCDVNFWHPFSHYFPGKTEGEITDAMMYGSGRYALDSIAAQHELKEKLALSGSEMKFFAGVEMGQPLQNEEMALKLAEDPRLDFIIGSHHMNMGVDDFYYLDYGRMSAQELNSLMTDCFEQMLEMCRWGKFDVLGHLTYPLRYISGEYGIELSLDPYEEIIREIFCTLIRNGKGIEINTSGLRQKYGRTFPELRYVKLYKELGGQILTVGSDAHRTGDLGKGIPEGIELARAAGFEYLTCFERHEPFFVKI
ncbi:MAG: histidinol-phosphatase HisJ family protein [Ruminococcus sp.]|nr:histidinol-phosphatase HisJ family protein [Ruminococcus sp.]